MPRQHDDLYDTAFSFQALRRAAIRAIRGKRRKPGAAAFMVNLEGELLRLERELKDRTYRPGGYIIIRIRDPKPRMVSAAPFRDRVVHHALCKVIEPLFERGFIHDSYANRIGKGTHRAIARYERFRNNHTHVLRCDIYRYFPSIDHDVRKTDIRRRICCDDTLWLIDRIIDGSNPQEPVNNYYSGDDLFTPYERRRGLPIGNLTSQFFANIYLDRLDHFCKEVLQAKAYLRYADDFALFHDDPAVLEKWRSQIDEHLAVRRLSLHPVKTFAAVNSETANFLGFDLLPDGRRRLPEASLRRFCNRLRGLRDRWRAGTLDQAQIKERVGAWIAHAENADTWRLRQELFRGGWFEPSSHLPRKPDRPPDTLFFAAAPGTTNLGTCARPTATGTAPETGTTTTGSALPARMIA